MKLQLNQKRFGLSSQSDKQTCNLLCKYRLWWNRPHIQNCGKQSNIGILSSDMICQRMDCRHSLTSPLGSCVNMVFLCLIPDSQNIIDTKPKRYYLYSLFMTLFAACTRADTVQPGSAEEPQWIRKKNWKRNVMFINVYKFNSITTITHCFKLNEIS